MITMEQLRQEIQLKMHNQVSTDYDIIEDVNRDEVIRLIPTIIYLLLIIIAGIPGNGLVCYIYRLKYTMSSSKWFIYFLASVDLILCIFIIPSEIATICFQYNFTDAVSCKITTFINLWALLSLGFTLVIVSIDRYRKVCRSLGWQINFNKARILCAVGVVVGFIISLPIFSVYGIHEIEFEVNGVNVTVSECSFRTSTTESSFAFYYVLFGMAIFTSALATICILYALIGTEIKQHIHKENIKRNVSLSASMAQRHRTAINTVSSKIELKSVRFDEGTMPKKVVRFQRPRDSGSTSNDGDEPSVSITHDSDDEDTCDFEIPVAPIRPRKAPKTKSRKMRRAKVRKATFSMFLISIAFVLSYLPFLSLLLVRSVINNFDETLSETGRAVYKFFLRSYFFNCAVNPFIYGISDSKFRESCKSVAGGLYKRVRSYCSRIC